MFGAFARVHDGGFGLSISILDIEYGFPLGYQVPANEGELFFKMMGVIWHKELKGKHVLLLSNSEAINSVEKVVPHIRLIEGLKEENE